MKKRLLYIVALILTGIASSAFVYGQSTVLERLQNKTWRWAESSYKYTCCERIAVRDYGRTISNFFYLSDTPTHTDFDDSKIGKVFNGRYIITPGPASNPELPVFANEIIELNDAILRIRLRDGITIATFRALEAHTMQYVVRNAPTSQSPFSGLRGVGSQDHPNVNMPLNTAVTDRLYRNVQLTQFENIANQRRGRILGKFAATNNNFIVVVTFGDLDNNRTDVLCLVNSSGTILRTIEGMVIVDGMLMKDYRLVSGQVEIRQVVPSSSTSLLFDNVTSFTGNVVTTVYSIASSSFDQLRTSTSGAKTFTRALLTNPDRTTVAEY
jgi:hypothetical protein